MTQPRIIAPEALDFAELIRPDETVGWAEATAEPVWLTHRLDAQADRCPPFRVFFALNLSDAFGAGHPQIAVSAFGGGGTGKRFFADDAGRVLPANLSGLCDLVDSGGLRIDIVLLQVSGPDAAGNYNAGIGIEHLHEAMAKARLVVAQRNDRLPWTVGDTTIPGDRIDILVPMPHPVLELPDRPGGPVEQAIAANIARLVPDQATLEFGIGAIPEAAARVLGGRRGLGIHSGAIGNGVLGLIESGAADNRHKEIDPGVTVGMLLLGSQRLYAHADRNPALHIRSPRYTHDAVVLGNFRRFIAINGAIDVDLTGQVNAETAAGRHIGLTGGQVDFVRAANRAPEGRSIIALQSTTRDRRHSRIVARLADGVVTTLRADADIVVTEHGIAELKGRTLEERARAMIAIADPEHRAALAQAAERLV